MEVISRVIPLMVNSPVTSAVVIFPWVLRLPRLVTLKEIFGYFSTCIH